MNSTGAARTRVLVVAALAALVVGAALGAGAATVVRGAPAASPQPSAVDVGFAQDMAVHHDQAVLMAGIARERGGSTVRALATTVETNQSQEIGTLRGWLTLWGEPQLPSGATMTWMSEGHHGGSGTVGDGAMPGLASVDELDRLRRASGDDFDRLYLELMSRHHEGGVVMAEDAALRGRLSTTRVLAQHVVLSQSTELTEMAALSLALDR